MELSCLGQKRAYNVTSTWPELRLTQQKQVNYICWLVNVSVDKPWFYRYLTWADIDMLNQNYNCSVEYSGTEGTIQSHDGYPLLPYNSSYRWANDHTSKPKQEAMEPDCGGGLSTSH